MGETESEPTDPDLTGRWQRTIYLRCHRPAEHGPVGVPLREAKYEVDTGETAYSTVASSASISLPHHVA